MTIKIDLDSLRSFLSQNIEGHEEGSDHRFTEGKLDRILETGEVDSQEELFNLCMLLGITPMDLELGRNKLADYKEREATGEFLDVSQVVAHRPYRVLELFAGAGGLALGLEKAGFDTVGLIEYDRQACRTLRTNRPNWNVIEGDIADVVERGIKNYIDGEIDILSGGYPCQAFSYAGKSLGLKDVRGTMFYYYARILDELRPKMFIAENVRGLVSHDRGRTLQGMLDVFEEIGYTVTYKVLNAVNHNVAQKRERIFIIGIRKDLPVGFKYPKPCEHILTLKDALRGVPESIGAKYPEGKRKVLEMVPPGGCWRDLPDEVARAYMGKSYFLGGGRTGMARRISWNEPSLTLTCSPAQKQTERCHPDETRPFTVREYARIQSFPDSWTFEGSMSDQYKQIGNAVPVELARRVGLAVTHTLNQIEFHHDMLLNFDLENEFRVRQLQFELV